MTYLFSSESVSEGHPDKLCDQISDAILDAALEQDPNSRIAAETFATTGLILIGGETNTTAKLNVQEIARNTIKEIGYTDPDFGIDAESCAVLNTLHQQSEDIAQGVNKGEGRFKELGAGDQGIMFGYACNQTSELMPLPIMLSHKLVQNLAKLRKSGTLPYLRPDSKSQVSVAYEGSTPKYIDTIVISTQHHPDVDQATIEKDLKESLIPNVIPTELLSENTRYLVNPTGRFVKGGPHGDAGLTGRKIIVDTYGGWAPHGGGAFSGKDNTKVDRSAAYMSRYIAKNIVAADIADEILIQLAYAIGVAAPVSIHIDTKGTAKIEESRLIEIIKSEFNLTPEGIIKTLNLTAPQFKQTASYGHFGRDDLNVHWEKCDKVDALKEASKSKAYG